MPPGWQGLGKDQFSKWQGLGNDYIVLHREQIPFELTPERVKLLCDRNLGIGSDGILVIGAQTAEDRFELRIFNPDGSEAEMCGNGVRMVARKLRWRGCSPATQVVLDTAAGDIVPKLGDGYMVTVDMGIARFGGEKLSGFEGEAVEESLHAAGRSFTFTFVDVGNPHAVIQSPWPLELVPLHEVGPMIEKHKFFPRKANVEFVKVVDEHDAKVRVWERGVGETRACGTGATATAVALVRTGRCTSPVTVELPGGRLVVEVKPDWRVFMTGPAEEIYHGDLSREFLDHLRDRPRAALSDDHLGGDEILAARPEPAAVPVRRASSARSPSGGPPVSTSSVSASATRTCRRRRTSSRRSREACGTRQPSVPSNRGELGFREAVAGYYATRFGVELDAGTEIVPAARRQGGHRPHRPGAPRPGRRGPGH